MSTGDDVGEIFLCLTETSSVEAGLSHGVRLACQAAGGLAGAIVVDWEPGRRPNYWFRHDPQGLLEQSIPEQYPAVTPPDLWDSAEEGNSERRRNLILPLSCGQRVAGWLVLVTGPDVSEDKVRCQLSATAAALAVLLLAVEREAAGAQVSTLGRDAFRAAVSAQITRSQSRGEVFSVLHLRTGGPEYSIDDRRPWSDTVRLGGMLLARLRRTDLVGLMAPDHLAVLLAGTGRLGARIAARRIELLLAGLGTCTQTTTEVAASGLTWCVRVFPEDSESASELCEAAWHADQAGPTAMAVRVT